MRSSRSQSAKTILGDLPPSSKATRLILSAESLDTDEPARVEPVNDIIPISGCFDSVAPANGPSPCIILKTPGGNPASCIISEYITDESGVNSDGFNMHVHPAAKAGRAFKAIWFTGQFQGVISPQIPTGSRTCTSPLESFSRSC